MNPHVCDLFLLFATGFSGKGGKEESMGRTNKSLMDGIPQGQRIAQAMRYYPILGSGSQGGKGNKGLECPVKKAGSPCKTVHPGIPIKKA